MTSLAFKLDFSTIIFGIFTIAFFLMLLCVVKRHKIPMDGLILDSDGKRVSRGGIIAYIILFVQLYYWLCKPEVPSPSGLTEAFGMVLLFLLGAKATNLGKIFLDIKRKKKEEGEDD